MIAGAWYASPAFETINLTASAYGERRCVKQAVHDAWLLEQKKKWRVTCQCSQASNT
jgi:hypothetical protein